MEGTNYEAVVETVPMSMMGAQEEMTTAANLHADAVEEVDSKETIEEKIEKKEDLANWVQRREYDKIAAHFTILAGSQQEAESLLQHVLSCYPPRNGKKRAAPPPSPPSSPMTETAAPGQTDYSFIQGDHFDSAVFTVLLLVPNDSTVIGGVIGPQGKHVKHITEVTGCLVNLDQKSEAAMIRTKPIVAFIQGRLQYTVRAVEMVLKKIESISTGYGWENACGSNRTVAIIPEALVRRVIGRNGTAVAKLQADSGASVRLQTDTQMRSAETPLYGREVVITGHFAARMHALYLICRLVIEDKDCPSSWKTSQTFPTPSRPAMSYMGGQYSNNQMHGPSPGAPPQQYGGQQQYNQVMRPPSLGGPIDHNQNQNRIQVTPHLAPAYGQPSHMSQPHQPAPMRQMPQTGHGQAVHGQTGPGHVQAGHVQAGHIPHAPPHNAPQTQSHAPYYSYPQYPYQTRK